MRIAPRRKIGFPKTTTNPEVQEASTLGLRPGQWPENIEYCKRIYTRRAWEKTEDGELISVKYVANNGDELIVYND